MREQSDVIVIGGGIIGTAILYQLSKRGISTTLIEKADYCHGTTGACDAYITPHTKAPGFHLDFCLKSQEIWKNLESELGEDLEYEDCCGGLQVCQNELEYKLVSENAEKLRAGGLDVRMLDIKEARQIEPALSKKLYGALYCPSAGQVNPFKTTLAYKKNALRLGAKEHLHTTVQKILMDDHGVVGVETDRGEFLAKKIVNATGCWGGQVASMAGLDLEILPRRGQILVTEPLPPLIHTTMQTGMYMVIKHYPELIKDERINRLGVGYCIEQTKDGTVLIGFTRELVGYDKGTTLEGIEAIAEIVCRHIPLLKGVHFIRTFAGFRPYVKDNVPMIGEVEALPGFFMAAGHEGDGVALSAVTGKVIADIIAEGTSNIDITPFSPNRWKRS